MSIHHRNLQKLAIEMFKIKKNLSPTPMNEIFKNYTSHYDLRNKRSWEVCKTRTVYFGTKTIRFRGPKTWEMLPSEIKKSNTLEEFRIKIKNWVPQGCTCRLCKVFIPELGFLE